MGKNSSAIMESVEEFLLGSPMAVSLKKASTTAKTVKKKAPAKAVEKAQKSSKKTPPKEKRKAA